MVKLYAIYRYSYDEGQIVEGSRTLIETGLTDRRHAEWVASVRTRNAQADDAPYVFQCEAVSRED